MVLLNLIASGKIVDQDWTEVEERGTPWFFRALLYFYRVGILNWWVCRGLLYPIMTFFFLVDSRLRTSSRKYLRKLAGARRPERLPESPGMRHSFFHVLEFGRSIFDRFSCWLGERHRYRIRTHGETLMKEAASRNRGALLLSFHAGNFYLMRYMALEAAMPINIVAYWDISPMVNELLRTADPASQMNVIEVDPSNPRSILDVKSRIDRGELVAILGDRESAGTSGRSIDVNFLGDAARLPAGPYIMAHVLECPVLLTYALRTGARTYDLHAEPFAGRINLPRADREEKLKQYGQKLADRMEEICCRAPYQWFNFYDFWAAGPESPTVASGRSAARKGGG